MTRSRLHNQRVPERGFSAETPGHGSSCSCLCIAHAALLTVSQEFDPLFMDNRDTGMMGLGAEQGPQPRVPLQQASCSSSWVGQLSRRLRTAREPPHALCTIHPFCSPGWGGRGR